MSEKKEYVPTGETHYLSTVNDIANLVTMDNYESLMKDVVSAFYMMAALKQKGTDLSDVKFNTIKWVDDGKNEWLGLTKKE